MKVEARSDLCPGDTSIGAWGNEEKAAAAGPPWSLEKP